MASFTEKSQKPPGGWELQLQAPMAFSSRVARNLQWGSYFGGENQKKKVMTNVPSKSLLGVHGKKGRVSFKKKVCAVNWFYFGPDYHNFAIKFR